MTVALQQLINALSLGGTYALLALGLAVVFSIVGLINFAHGELMTMAGYAAFFALALALPLPLVVLLAVAAAGLLALLIERVAFRPMRRASPTSLLITSFAVSEVLRVLFQNGISARPKPIALPDWLSGTVAPLGFTIGVTPLLSIATAGIVLLALNLFLHRTVAGTAMRAAAEDFPIVRSLGIRADRVVALSFLISGLLAGVAALLWVANRGSVDPLMGFIPVLKAFIAAIIGGIGSLSGAVLGGFLLGALEVLLQSTLPTSMLPFRDAIVFGIVTAVLVYRPGGLLAPKAARRF